MLVALAAISFVYGAFYKHAERGWENDVITALDSAAVWESRAEGWKVLADSTTIVADSLKQQSTERVRVVRERVVEVREVEVPAIARPFVAQRDSIIDELLGVVEMQEEVIEEYVTVAEFLRRQSGAFEMRGDSLEAVLLDRPGPRAWWMPKTGVGPFVGFCQSGGICSGVGLTLSWSL